MFKVEKNMLLIDIFQRENVNVDAMANVLADFGMHCLGCALSHGETVEEAAAVHGVDADAMCNALTEAANS